MGPCDVAPPPPLLPVLVPCVLELVLSALLSELLAPLRPEAARGAGRCSRFLIEDLQESEERH